MINISTIKAGDQILFNHIVFDKNSNQITIVKKQATVINVCVSPMPHIPDKVCIEMPDGKYGLRHEDIIDHITI